MVNEMDAENLKRLKETAQHLKASIRRLNIALARSKERMELEAALAKRQMEIDTAGRDQTE